MGFHVHAQKSLFILGEIKILHPLDVVDGTEKERETDEELEEFQEAFGRMKRSAGVGNVDEVVDRLMIQKDTYS